MASKYHWLAGGGLLADLAGPADLCVRGCWAVPYQWAVPCQIGGALPIGGAYQWAVSYQWAVRYQWAMPAEWAGSMGWNMPVVSSFEELDVYKLAIREADVLFNLSASFPPDERFALTNQIRRSSSSVAPLIAEAWPRRWYQRAFINTLRIAAGEVCETQAWLHHAEKRGYISAQERSDIADRWEHINAMLYGMIGKAPQFAGRRRRER